MTRIFAASLICLSALSASAMTPAAESLLKKLGLDPKSEEIVALAGDKVGTKDGIVTLDSLSAKGDVPAVKAFLVTREFFHAFSENWDIEFPNDELYDIRYLTDAEKIYMAKKLMEGYPVLEKAPALPPATVSFLKELGMDPESDRIRAIASDSVTTASGKVKTLDALAAKRDETGVKSFIATRGFIRGLKRDYEGTSIPKAQYDPLYLTGEERALVGRKLAEALFKKKH